MAASVKNQTGPDKQGFHEDDALQKRGALAQLIAQRHEPVEDNMIDTVAGFIDTHGPIPSPLPDSSIL